MKYDLKDYIGKEVWYLKVIGLDPNNSGKEQKWLFLCKCGNYISECPSRVIQGCIRSCGCMRYNRSPRKRKTASCEKPTVWHSPYYNTWRAMMKRCYCKRHESYKNYGAKGITVCDEWRDPHAFMKWAEDTKPDSNEQLTLERIDNEKAYSPENCTWATRLQQTRNRRNTVYWTIDGETKTLGEWCEQYGIKYQVVRARYYQCGWDMKRSLETPVK